MSLMIHPYILPQKKKKKKMLQKLIEYLPSMKLDDYSFEFHQEHVNK